MATLLFNSRPYEAPAYSWRKEESSGKWLKPEYSEEQQQRLFGMADTKYGGVVSEVVISAAKSGTLVPMVGAGTSCVPPTALPSWKSVNQAVLRGIWDRACQCNSSDEQLQAYIDRFGSSISDTLEDNELPPEFFSEIIVNRLGDFYFNVLSVLDSDKVNSVHMTLAKLAKIGAVRVIVTTNFDTCIESALEYQGVRPIVYKGVATFDAERLKRGLHDTPHDPASPCCFVLKVHGSADDASSVVDTLAQRSIGLGKDITDSIDVALNYGHWLFMGFSGADLVGERNYLQIRPSMDSAVGYTWLTRYCEEPLPAVTQLGCDYPHGKAQMLYGELPNCLTPLEHFIAENSEGKGKGESEDEDEDEDEGVKARVRVKQQELGESKTPLRRASLKKIISLEERVKKWADRLMPEEALVVLIDLSDNVATEKQVGKALATHSEGSSTETTSSLRVRTGATSIPECKEKALSIMWNTSVRFLCAELSISTQFDESDMEGEALLEILEDAKPPSDMSASYIRHVNACCWLAELLAYSSDLKNEWKKAEHKTRVALLLVEKCNSSRASYGNSLNTSFEEKKSSQKSATATSDIASSVVSTSSTHRELANDILRRFIVRRQNKLENQKIQQGHDSLNDIESPVTTWLHMLESKAKLIEMQAERLRLNDSAITHSNEKDNEGKEVDATTRLKQRFGRAVTKFQDAIRAYHVLPVNARSQRGVCRCQMGICNVRRAIFAPSEATEVRDLLADYDVVVALAKQIGDQALEATQQKNKGVVLKSRAKICADDSMERSACLQDALQCYQNASEVQGRLGEHQERVKSLRGIAGVRQMLGEYLPALEACEESIRLAKACGYRAGVTRAQRVQAEIVVSMVEQQEGEDEAPSDRREDRQNLEKAKIIAVELMDNVTSSNHVKAGDLARATFVAARVRMAIQKFLGNAVDGVNVDDEDLEVAKGVNTETTVEMLRKAKKLFDEACDQTMSSQVSKYCLKREISIV